MSLSRAISLLLVLTGAFFARADGFGILGKGDGYRGVWYMNQPSGDEYKYKYSGGFATYPQQQVPIAIYCKEVNKTFFCYGGTTATNDSDKQELLHMVSYFDHATGMVPRPTILLNKHTSDAHENPTIAIDDSGYIWIFSSTHGAGRNTSYIHRSTKPYSIEDFVRVAVTNFSYAEPWYLPTKGFLFLHTHYIKGERNLFWQTSADGLNWDPAHHLAHIEMGDYQVSWRDGTRLATAFDFHPRPIGLNGRANVYYLETSDVGKTWTTADGTPVTLPLTKTNNPALIYDSRKEGKLAYLKDIAYDAQHHPVILFLISKGYASGPKNGPRQWKTARWDGKQWVFKDFTTSDSNYDHGSLYIEADGTWRVIAPTDAGPQPYNPGGEMVMWTSNDEGTTWKAVKQLTHDSKLNHTYARKPVNANPEFYSLWADGNARQPSMSSIYFTDQKGTHVWRLPTKMTEDFAKPEIAW